MGIWEIVFFQKKVVIIISLLFTTKQNPCSEHSQQRTPEPKSLKLCLTQVAKGYFSVFCSNKIHAIRYSALLLVSYHDNHTDIQTYTAMLNLCTGSLEVLKASNFLLHHTEYSGNLVRRVQAEVIGLLVVPSCLYPDHILVLKS